MQADPSSLPPPEQAPPQPIPAPDRGPPTPLLWRAAIAAGVLALGLAAYLLSARGIIGGRGQAAAGVFCFFGLVAAFSSNLRAVNWRTIGWGVGLQVVLA